MVTIEMIFDFRSPVLALLFTASAMKAVTSFIRYPVPHSFKGHFHSVSALQAKQKSGSDGGKAPKKASTAFVSIEYVESELWKLEPIIDILRNGEQKILFSV